jgi:hypothetical protein
VNERDDDDRVFRFVGWCLLAIYLPGFLLLVSEFFR